MSLSADILRRAAAKARTIVAALPEGHNTRWKAVTLPPNDQHDSYAWWVNTDPDNDPRLGLEDDRSYATVADCTWSRADADHIALWNPAVALAVAEWLEACAATWPTQPVITTTTERSRERRAALAVAHALLGEETDRG